MRFVLRWLGRRAWPVMVFRVGLAIRRHWRQTSPKDRTRVQELLKRSRGRPANLTADERRDLLRSARALQPTKLIRDLAATGIKPGRRNTTCT